MTAQPVETTPDHIPAPAVHFDGPSLPIAHLPRWPMAPHTYTAPTERQSITLPDPIGVPTGPVIVIVQAHSDDLSFFGAGTVARLIHEEGYTAYLIQTTNDDKCGPTPSLGETILANERETEALAAILGIRRVFNLGYANHFLDAVSVAELRARLIFLFRLLRPDVVMTFNPAQRAEQNPDHWVTGQAVEAARWMAGLDKDYPEHLAAGLAPHIVRGRLYWVARAGQPANRVIDVSAYLDQKVDALAVHQVQGPAGSTGRRLRATLATQGRRLPELGDDDVTADRAYIRRYCLGLGASVGAPYGVSHAEAFYYIDDSDGDDHEDEVRAWIEASAVPI